MTLALCVKCGVFKHGAFNPCESCGFRPIDDLDMAYSLALTDHHFTAETLKEIGAEIPQMGVPSLPLDQEKELLTVVRDPRIRGMVPRCAPERRAIKRKTNVEASMISRLEDTCTDISHMLRERHPAIHLFGGLGLHAAAFLTAAWLMALLAEAPYVGWLIREMFYGPPEGHF